jgi:hypothetical protein
MQRRGGAPAASADDSAGLSGPSGAARWAAAVHVRNTTGFACYEADTNELWVAEGHDDPADWAFLRLALAHAAPRCVFASSTASDDFIQALSAALADAAAGLDADADAASGGAAGGAARGSEADYARAPRLEVRIEKATLFTLDAARRRLCTTSVDAIPAAAARDAAGAPNVHALHAMMRLDAEAQVRAAGALVAILQRDGLLPAGALGSDASPARLASIRERSLSGYLQMDPATVQSLAVFALEAHPSHFTGSAKEGLSVFGVLNTCVTQARRASRAPASRAAELWFGNGRRVRRPQLAERGVQHSTKPRCARARADVSAAPAGRQAPAAHLVSAAAGGPGSDRRAP